MPISTNGTVVARFAGALYNQQLSNATYTEVVTWSNTNNLAGLINEVYARDFSLMSDSAVATLFVANLGLSAIAGTQAYVAAQLTAAGANKGGMLASLLNTFSQMTADPVYGAAATAFNAQVVISQSLSQTAGNGGGAFTVINTVGTTYSLTTGFDNLVGTSFNDIFNAPTVNGVNRLNDGDRLDGGAGFDTVYVDYASVGNAITPNFRNIESVVIRAQSAGGDANGTGGATDGNNQTNLRTVQIDAQRSLATDVANKVTADLGVVNWESSNSRSDVVIEDVRIGNTQKTKDVTITFRESDPGNVDFGVYFDVNSLRNAGTGTASLNIFLMDTAAAAATPATPLLNQNFNTYTFFSNNVKVILGGTGTAAGTAIDNATTYAQLKDAFILALKTASVGGVTTDLSASVTVTSSGPVNMTTESAKATESATVSANFLGLTGEIITLTSTGSASITSKNTVTNEAGGWTAAGPAPATGAIVQTLNTGATSTTELVTSKVVLDDVGRGSTGGDLLIGSMSVGDTSTSRGVERFEISVEDSSKLQTINSTNNALREVTIVNGTTSNSSSAYITVVANSGDLTVNGNVGVADDNLAGVNNNSTWGAGVNGTTASSQSTLNHSGTGAAGFTDVRLIDASAMTGKFNFTAAVSVDSIGKYVNAVDTASSPTADVAGTGNVNFNVKGANFIYTGGANDDTMVVSVDANVAASRSTIVSGKSDFTFNISGGAGNDAITLNLAGQRDANGDPVLLGNAEAWYTNQVLNKNITINGGAGNDTIRKPGAGNATIDAGDGNDVVYSDNSGATSSGSYTSAVSVSGGGSQESTARWVFNTANQTAAVTPAARTLADLVSSSNSSYGMFNSKLTVTFKGLTASATVESTAYKSTDLQINQAIKSAINTDAVLSKLLIATDGPANTLVVTALSDGTRAVTDLGVALTSPAATAISASDVTAYNAANTTVFADAAALVVGLNAINAALGTTGAVGNDYNARFANTGAANDINGINSQTTTDNTITPGAGNDVIVLSTTEGTNGNDIAANNRDSSNETLVFSGSFGDDVVVNFQSNTGSVPGTTETVPVTWQAFAVAGTQVIGGMTITATGAFTDLQVAQVAGGGAAIAGLTITTAPTLWTVGTAGGTAITTFTSTIALSQVTDIAGAAFTGVGNAAPAAGVIVQGVDALLGGDIINLKAFLGTAATTLANAVDANAAYGTLTDSQITRATLDATGTALTGVRNDSAAEVQKYFATTVDTAVTAATKSAYVVINAAGNTGSVYSIVNGAAVGDAVATLVGSINLADTPWANLTLANFS